jgi:hypothetical protein
MNSITDFYREACDLLTRYGSTLPQPPATEENAIAFCRALAEEGIPVPDFPQMREDDSDTESEVSDETECDWACDCGEEGMEDDPHIQSLHDDRVICEGCLETCPNCDYKLMPDDGDRWDGTGVDECECVVCDICEERKDGEDGTDTGAGWVCWDCRETYDKIEVILGMNTDGQMACCLIVDGEEAETTVPDGEGDIPPAAGLTGTYYRFWEFKAMSKNSLVINAEWEVREDKNYTIHNIKRVYAEYDRSCVEPETFSWKIDEDGFDF